MAFVGGISVLLGARSAHKAATGRRPGARAAVVMKANVSALIFDCDGVLADTERDAHRVAFNVAFDEFQVDTEWDVDRYGKLLEVGGGKERMTAHFDEVGWPSGYTEEARSDLVKALHKRKTELFMELASTGKIPLRPGIQRLADEAARQNIPVVVCSTSNEKAVAEIVRLLGDDLFSSIRIFAGDVVAKKKPAPDIYNLATEELKLDPKRCVVVEDSHIGLTSAKEAGMNCIVTKSTYTADEDFSRADLIVDDLETGNVSISSLSELVD